MKICPLVDSIEESSSPSSKERIKLRKIEVPQKTEIGLLSSKIALRKSGDDVAKKLIFIILTPIFLFCDIIISAINTESKEIIIHNNDELELLIQYYDTIHWATHVRLNRAIIYALSNLFTNGVVNENILYWIKRNYNRIQFSFNTGTLFFNTADFGKLVKSSSLNIFDKLMLLKYTSPQFKDAKLLLSAIDEYNKTESIIEKEKYRDILIRIL